MEEGNLQILLRFLLPWRYFLVQKVLLGKVSKFIDKILSLTLVVLCNLT